MSSPSQISASGEAIVAGSAGGKMLSTTMLPVAEQPLSVETVTMYSPLWEISIFGITGFSKVDVNPFGPLHEYARFVTPDPLAKSSNEPPVQLSGVT